MKHVLKKFLDDPLGFTKISFYKLFVAPIKYGSKDDYDAAKYWDDRFKKHGPSLQAVGDEGLSPEDNKEMYEKAANQFKKIISEKCLNFESINTLEIGCGTGFYTNILSELGIQNYTGIDITDSFFPIIRKKHPDFNFIKSDITAHNLTDTYNLIVMIDVIQHIVNIEKFSSTIKKLTSALAPNGILILSPITSKPKKHLFNVRFWTAENIKEHLPDGFSLELIPYRMSNLVVIQNKA